MFIDKIRRDFFFSYQPESEDCRISTSRKYIYPYPSKTYEGSHESRLFGLFYLL